MTSLKALPPQKELIRRSLTYSLYDGIAFSIMFGMSDSFFQAYGIHLGADNFALSLIRTLPITVGSLSQLLAGLFLRLFKSRRRFTAFFSLIQALLFIPLILASQLPTGNVAAVIIILCLMTFFFLTPVPAWSSWMGDLVPENIRGQYFGRRTSITGIVSFLSLLAAGFILEVAQLNDLEYVGFIILFAISFISRSISAYFLSKKYDPPYNYQPKSYFNLRLLKSEAKKAGTLSLIMFLSLLNFGLMLIAPYIDIYLLRHLKLSYVAFTLINATILGIKYFFMPFWGKACDRYGSRKVLLVGTLLISFVPLGWIFATILPVILILQVFAGFAWAAFEISSFSIVIGATSSASRASWVSLQNTASGIFGLLGSFTSTALYALGQTVFPPPLADPISPQEPGLPFFLSPFFFIFLLSGLIRLGLLVIFNKKIKEQREVIHIETHELPWRIISMITNRGFVLGTALMARLKNKKRKAAPAIPAACPKPVKRKHRTPLPHSD